MLRNVSAVPTLTTNSRRALSPLRVIVAPPSIVVLALMVLVLLRWISAVPQLKVTVPPPASRLLN